MRLRQLSLFSTLGGITCVRKKIFTFSSSRPPPPGTHISHFAFFSMFANLCTLAIVWSLRMRSQFPSVSTFKLRAWPSTLAFFNTFHVTIVTVLYEFKNSALFLLDPAAPVPSHVHLFTSLSFLIRSIITLPIKFIYSHFTHYYLPSTPAQCAACGAFL